MKKKIFHFVSTNILSGLENMVINISTLVKGYDYTYVSPDGPINDYLDKLGIKHISIKKMTPFNVKKIIKKYNPDIVHGHDVKASISLAFNYFICHNKNIKIISELHSDDIRMHKITLRSVLYMLSSKFYNKIIVVSNPIINNYVFYKKISNKTTVINNVINPLKIYNSINHYDNSFKKWDCIYIGRFSSEKNPLLFVKIIYDLKKYKNDILAVMVGDGELKYSVTKLIHDYGLSNNIFLVGFQFNPYKYLKNSKLLLIPSTFEGFGLVALESLIVGTPVIASSVGGLKAIVDENCGYLITRYKDFIEKSYLLLSNKNLYNYKKKHAYIRFKQLNNIPKFKKLYKSVYDY